MPPAYVFVADDFTGATDTLATLARAGRSVRLFLDVPSPDEVQGLDAFGIATGARALDNERLDALMERIGNRLAPHRPDILHLKICSTFDSSPTTGNFARSMAALSRATGIARQAIVGGQPSLGRYCIFGHLFARAADGGVHRIDRHPVMRVHPVTPMTESDLALHFAGLGGARPARVDHSSLNADAPWSESGPVLFDALEADDIERIGRHLRRAAPVLAAGASSVAEAVMGAAAPRPVARQRLRAPVLAFAGSRSAVSAEQVARAGAFARLPVPPRSLLDPTEHRTIGAEAAAALASGQHVLLSLEDTTGDANAPHELARLSADLVSDILGGGDAGALLVAGGDTSSAILRRLAPHAIAYEGDIDPGVSLCRADFEDAPSLPIVLKGGQVGKLSLFDDIVGQVLCFAPGRKTQ
ncbi:four-carbon acid sugar kinase family protein [Psychromarinibacter sp. C21-152]|uniref:Four-carbon acid sugar kinase family protein n=1 Tax=Psychromarinibacter sediminicola TaxID=3033385 RepID=A0AAE3NNJ0_9RHOB|nr:four-carbon acid sugar kinase family protein [Psychromarinibacter sediminicola]MDF0601263.1 four-carbon acid sugar kinase family protein [Psychromarinibacter sediminicola]